MNTTDFKKASSLEVRVLAENYANIHAKKCIEHELSILKEYLGKDILKVDGSFKAKYAHKGQPIEEKIEVNGFKYFIFTNYYFKADYGKLTINTRTCITGGGADKNGVNHHCLYIDRWVDLFSVANLILEEIPINYSSLDIVYNEGEILESVSNFNKVKEEYKKAVENVPYPFRDLFYIKTVY